MVLIWWLKGGLIEVYLCLIKVEIVVWEMGRSGWREKEISGVECDTLEMTGLSPWDS